MSNRSAGLPGQRLGRTRSATRLRIGAGVACALAVVAATIGTAPAARAAEAQIKSGELTVDVSTAFPKVLRYYKDGKELAGSASEAGVLRVNGEDHQPRVRASRVGADRYSYLLELPKLRGAKVWADLAVAGSTVEFRVTRIADPNKRIRTLQIPDHDLVTVSSADPGAKVASAVISVDRARSGDTFEDITADATPYAEPKLSRTVIANTDALAAGFETNSQYDTDSGGGETGRKLVRNLVKDGSGTRMGVSPAEWLIRAQDSPDVEPLPWAKVVITGDANGDKRVDWQDGAIATRQIAVRPAGGQDVKNRVITHIPFNFASQATHPFLRTLDDVKRISRATDGLGQYALEKGYTSEGHDSSNTDYGGNYNERAGGLKDFNTLLKEGKPYGATFGVHVNATEAYPESNAFSEELIDIDSPGWNWLDQSWHIDQRRDILSGDLAARFNQLADETDDNLTALYIDVFRKQGWLSRRTQDIVREAGFDITTEWSYSLTDNSTWSHWANDENYGGSNNKGINSDITRFMDNDQRDVWNPHPLLGTSHIVEFEGWTGNVNYDAFMTNVFANNLPVKYLQQREITSWAPNKIGFADGAQVTGTSLADRVITASGQEVLRGDSYLLPWASAPVEFGKNAENDPTLRKLYHYNAKGGQTTWRLTPEFAGAKQLLAYKLTDDGRELAATLPVRGGSVTIDAEADQPYVLVPDASVVTVPAEVDYGQASPVADPGFNEADLGAWAPTGGAKTGVAGQGHRVAQLGSAKSSLSQQLKPLPADGTYSVSAWVEIKSGKTRPVTLRVAGAGKNGSAAMTVSQSEQRNMVAADEKNDLYFQRVRVLVDAKAGARPRLTLSAPAGAAVVKIDDVRVVPTKRVPTEGVLAEDYENTDQGWWPFVKGNAGGITDPRTHIARRNEPYTQKGWNGRTTSDILDGQFSLHSHQENRGTVYRTNNYTLPMKPGNKYRVSFDYQSSTPDGYAWVRGYDQKGAQFETGRTPIPTATETTRFSEEIVAPQCGPGWFGLERTRMGERPEFTLDNLLVEDLGPASGAPLACATLSVAPQGDFEAGSADNELITTLTNRESAEVRNAAVELTLPAGWSATAVAGARADRLAPGAELVTTWRVSAPDGVQGQLDISATGRYTTTKAPVGERSLTATARVKMAPLPPTGDAWLSDLEWLGTPVNGWGPPERDQSNGESGSGDGTPLKMAGKTYEKGLGTHAEASIRYNLGSKCREFSAIVGVDDIQGTAGSVTFSVLGDGKELAKTGVLRGGQAPETLTVDVTGVKELNLVVGDGGDGVGNDHADWANARVTCG